MKGIILAAGEGTRLSPLSSITNKCLLPCGKEPMLWHQLRHMKDCGIKDITIVCNPSSRNATKATVIQYTILMNHVLNVTYTIQYNSYGLVNAIECALEHTNNIEDDLMIMLGDGIYTHSLLNNVNLFKESDKQCGIVLHEQPTDLNRFGIAELDINGGLVGIEEKPVLPKSNFVVTGTYFIKKDSIDLLLWLVQRCKEIDFILNEYIQVDQCMYTFTRGKWIDAGTHEDYRKANNILYKQDNKIL